MKKSYLLFSVVIALSLLLSACGGGGAAPSPTEPQPRTISVNGSGVVTLTPDMATISIGVQTENTQAERAVSQNTRQAQAVADALAEFGIEPRDIKTTNFSIYPRQDRDNEGILRQVYYVVNNTVLVTVRDLDSLGEVLDAVVQAGANSINNISFDASDRESAYQDALEAAMENAIARATILAEAAGAELGDVQNIYTNIYGGGEVVVERAVSMDFAAEGASVPVSAGQMEIRVEVSVVYEIK
jgi:uncharacterized protein YggE